MTGPLRRWYGPGVVAVAAALLAGGLVMTPAAPAAAAVGDIVTYPVGIVPTDVALGADGNLWVGRRTNGAVVRVTPSGTRTFFPMDLSEPVQAITPGPDGNLWFTLGGDEPIGRITTAGVVTEFEDPSNLVNGGAGIVTGPDGNLWFTSANNDRIGRIDPDTGTITAFTDPDGMVDRPRGITAGPDGRLWFTSTLNDRIGAIDPGTGVIETFTGNPAEMDPQADIVTGPDGNLWFTNLATDLIGRIDPATGSIDMLPDPGGHVNGPLGITVGPDGAIWFTNVGFGGSDDTISRVDPGTSEITSHADPNGMIQGASGITSGPDGAVWFVARTNVGRLEVVSSSVAGTVSVSGSGDPVAGAWVAVLDAADFSLAAGGVTDASGGFDVEVPPGSYFVYVIDPAGDHVSGFHGAPAPVVVSAGQETQVNPVVVALAGSVSGVVSGPGGALPGAMVFSVSASTGAPGRATVTGAGGGYELPGLSPGGRLLVFADSAGAHATRYFGGTAGPGGASVVPVSAGSHATADQVLPAQSPGGGGAGVSGTVVDSVSGQGLGAVFVVALRASDYSMARAAVSGPSGAFSVPVGAGTYKLVFVDPQAVHAQEWFDDHPYDAIGSADSVTAPGPVGTVGLARFGGVVSGTVSAGGPVAGVWVVAIGPSGPAGGAVTGADGGYVIEGLAPGTYRAAFVDPTGAFPVEYWNNSATFAGATPFGLTAGATADIDATLGP